MKIITDEFSSLPISRQRRYQLRHERDGICKLCDEPAAKDSAFCATHLKKQRQWCCVSPKKNYNPADLV